MNAATNVIPMKPASLTATHGERNPYNIDAALGSQGPLSLITRRLPMDVLLRTWREAITADRLSDVRIPSPYTLTVDPRDGALCRGAGGTAYTHHAFSQLVALMKAGQPGNSPNVWEWNRPVTRHFAWEDVKAAGDRPRSGTKGEAVLRMFQVWVGEKENRRAFPCVRAVVSGIHGLADTDDSNVLAVIDALEEAPIEGRISRGWDHTYGSFLLAAGTPETRLGFAFHNSETGCGSIEFSSSLFITALDTEVVMPNGEKFQRMVSIASERSGTTRRRHTLPRFDSRTGQLFTPAQRTAIAAGRIGKDIDTALEGSRIMAEAWENARNDVRPDAMALATIAANDEVGRAVLSDFFDENGMGAMKEYIEPLCTILADDARLRTLPHGSAAHWAATLALLAQSGEGRTWEQARELQRMAGEFVLGGWSGNGYGEK